MDGLNKHGIFTSWKYMQLIKMITKIFKVHRVKNDDTSDTR